MHRGKVVYDGPSSALTPQLLGELYGTDIDELFDMLLESPAVKLPPSRKPSPSLATQAV